MKDSAKIVFDIKIMTKNDVIFCAYLRKEHEISAILSSNDLTMSIKNDHRHHDEECTCMIALELGWFLKKGPVTPFKACLVRKAKQLAINKHVVDIKKAMRAGKNVYRLSND